MSLMRGLVISVAIILGVSIKIICMIIYSLLLEQGHGRVGEELLKPGMKHMRLLMTRLL